MTDGHTTAAFVDAHCHVDLFPHPAQIVEQAEAQHIYTIAVTNAPSVFEHTARLAEGSKYIRAALGLHPELVHSHQHELDQFRLFLTQTRYIGEVGLDYTTLDQDIRSQQRRVLATIGGWANESADKILTLHSRRAVSDTLDVLKGIKARMILHWFSGTKKELDRAMADGYYFSVNGAMMQSAKGRALVARMPRHQILTETDAPFVKIGTSSATPSAVVATVTQLAEFWKLQPTEAQAVVLENFRALLVNPVS